MIVKVRVGVEPTALASWVGGDDLGREIRATAPLFRVTPKRSELSAKHGLDRWVRCTLRDGADAEAIAASLSALDPLVEIARVPGPMMSGGDVPLPNDPQFAQQYGLHNTGQVIHSVAGVVDADCDGPEAWEVEPGQPVIVGVVDAGVAPHQDFADRLLAGWNVLTQTVGTTESCSGHGTHVAGIIAAKRNNGMAIAGMNDAAIILPVQVFNNTCGSTEAIVAEGFVWAADHDARIINASIHGYNRSQVLEDAVNYCYDAGILLVAIAGNNEAEVAYPGKYEHAVAVAATTNTDQRANFSNNGPEVEIAAAGSNIVSTIGGISTTLKSGTSMAAPHVAGLASLLLGRAPWLTPDALWALIRDTADDVDDPGFDEDTGWGRINAHSAVTTLLERLAAGDLDADGTVGASDIALLLGAWGQSGASDPGDVNGDGVVEAGDLAILLGAWGG